MTQESKTAYHTTLVALRERREAVDQAIREIERLIEGPDASALHGRMLFSSQEIGYLRAAIEGAAKHGHHPFSDDAQQPDIFAVTSNQYGLPELFWEMKFDRLRGLVQHLISEGLIVRYRAPDGSQPNATLAQTNWLDCPGGALEQRGYVRVRRR